MILKMLKRTVLAVVLFVVYLVSTVPVGLFLYSMKSKDLGLNIFTKTGFHAYMQCLQEQAYKIEKSQGKPNNPDIAYKNEIENNKDRSDSNSTKIIK